METSCSHLPNCTVSHCSRTKNLQWQPQVSFGSNDVILPTVGTMVTVSYMESVSLIVTGQLTAIKKLIIIVLKKNQADICDKTRRNRRAVLNNCVCSDRICLFLVPCHHSCNVRHKRYLKRMADCRQVTVWLWTHIHLNTGKKGGLCTKARPSKEETITLDVD